MDANKIINTGIKFFGLKILLESTGDKETDKAAKTAFDAAYWVASPPASRPDVRKMLEWSQEQQQGQKGLFDA